MSTLRSGIDRFEADVAEYEARGQPKPSDEILRAVLLQLVPENLEEHLELNIQRFDTYSKMRAEVISFLEQKVSKSLIDDGGAAPMELDYVGGKGKGKKGKDKGGSVRTCYYCNKPGHLAKDCWQNPKGKGKNGQGSSSNKGKGDHKGRGKGSKGTKAQGKGKGQKSGKNQAMEGDEPEGEHLAEGEEWADYQNQEDWPDNEATYEEPGEQGAICVGEGLSAVSARAKAASRAAQKLQKDFEAGKLWKRPQNFWCMPWKLVCQETRYKGTLVCGYQGCWRNNTAFHTENSYKQHLWSKVGTEGHPNRMQLDAWELRDYLVPHGQKPYPLWDQALGKIKDVEPASGDDEVLHRAQAGGGGCVKLMDKQKEKMRQRLSYGPDQEGEGGEEEDPPESDDSVSEISVKSDYNVIHDLVSDEEAERKKTSKLRLTATSKAKAIEKSKESRAKERKDPRPPLPRLRERKRRKKRKKSWMRDLHWRGRYH